MAAQGTSERGRGSGFSSSCASSFSNSNFRALMEIKRGLQITSKLVRGFIAAMLTAPAASNADSRGCKNLRPQENEENILTIQDPTPLEDLLSETSQDLKAGDALTDVVLLPQQLEHHLCATIELWDEALHVPRFNTSLLDACLATSAALARQFEVPEPENGEAKTISATWLTEHSVQTTQ